MNKVSLMNCLWHIIILEIGTIGVHVCFFRLNQNELLKHGRHLPTSSKSQIPNNTFEWKTASKLTPPTENAHRMAKFNYCYSTGVELRSKQWNKLLSSLNAHKNGWTEVGKYDSMLMMSIWSMSGLDALYECITMLKTAEGLLRKWQIRKSNVSKCNPYTLLK